MVSPASGSDAVTLPTTALVPAFSAMVKLASAAVGASLTSVTPTVTVAVSVRPPESVTVTVRVRLGAVS